MSGTGQIGDGTQTAILQRQGGQLRKFCQNGQVIGREGRPGQIQGGQTGQFRKTGERVNTAVLNGQRCQIGHQADIVNDRSVFRHSKLLNIPQLIGIDCLFCSRHNSGADGRLHSGVGEGNFLNNTGNGVVQHGQRTDKTALTDTHRKNGGFASGKSDGFAVTGLGDGGIISIQGVKNGVTGGSECNIHIFAVIARSVIRRWSGGTLCLNFGFYFRIGNVFQQVNGVQNLILFHKNRTEGGIQFRRGGRSNGSGQGHLRLGVISGISVLIGKLNGNALLLAGEFVCHIIEKGRQLRIPVQILESGLTEQGVPGELPVIDEQVPHNTGANKEQQNQRYQNSGSFFHRKILHFEKISLNYTTYTV